ncbi:hypothetical protein EHZ61_18885, partial [Aeromonas caviae]
EGASAEWLAGIDGYDLVLLDLPLGMAPVIPCRRLLVVNADANCHVRLHRHPWAAGGVSRFRRGGRDPLCGPVDP